MDITLLIIILGFLLAAYSIVANDAIQTLGTFLSSNAHRPWWLLWIYITGILTAVLVYGWYVNGGDVSYGRLDKFPPPEVWEWYYLLPPLAILILTRMGIPVSTTFLVLTVFTTANLDKMLTKSILGYLVAFAAAYLIYRFVAAQFEKRFIKESADAIPASYWIALQWLSTGFLWSQWLIQDLANIYVYMPSRELDSTWLIASLLLIYLLFAVIIYQRGGKIQRIITTKTNTFDIRSATIIDAIYGIILLIFKEMSNIPMSTTWVFLGLLAGREFAIAWLTHLRTNKQTAHIVGSDAGKAMIGLAVSIALAFSIPLLKEPMQPKTAHNEAATNVASLTE